MNIFNYASWLLLCLAYDKDTLTVKKKKIPTQGYYNIYKGIH